MFRTLTRAMAATVLFASCVPAAEPMTKRRRRKYLNCRRLFRPDPRNVRHPDAAEGMRAFLEKRPNPTEPLTRTDIGATVRY